MSYSLPQFTETLETMESAGFGALESPRGNLPLKRIDVRCRVDGLACQTRILQVFHNPHAEFVEATYIFPLPGRFAVTACTMRVQDRLIEAELKERSQARTEYDQAIRAGHRAAIAEEERSETFTLRVGNIPPQQDITVELTLCGMISVVAGEGTLRIPLVVAPRYVPGIPLPGMSVGMGTACDTDEVPDASRVTPPTLLPGFPNLVELSVEVELNPGQSAVDPAWRLAISSSLHSVIVSEGAPCRIRLIPGERVNRDFILRFPILRSAVHSTLQYSHPDGLQAGIFAVTLFPPANPVQVPRPRDVVFVLDRSGSMAGWKMIAARRAVARMIDTLRDEDRFCVLAFDNEIETPHGRTFEWQPATDRNRWHAAEWIAKIESRGGTELGGALRSALQPFATFGMPESREAIVVLATDGEVAGEDSVLRTVASLGFARLPRIFALGIDRAVNASLLTRLAEMGNGAFEIVESEERLDQVMERFHRTFGTPVLTHVSIEPLGFDLVSASVAPERFPDVFADRPVTIFGRVAGHGEQLAVRVRAQDAVGNPWQQDLLAQRSEVTALLPIWGRCRVRDLEDRFARGDQNSRQLQTQIVAISLESHVLCRFTAYVAVDRAEVVNLGGTLHKIVQPVEVPDGWEQRGILRSVGTPRAKQGRCSNAADVFGAAIALPSAGAPAPACAGPAQAKDLIPESVAREYNVLPVDIKDGKLVVRMTDPNDAKTLERLRFINRREIVVEQASAEEIQEGITKQYGATETESVDSLLAEFKETAIDFTESSDDSDSFEDSDDLLADSDADIDPMIEKLVILIVKDAAGRRASHVYIRPVAMNLTYCCIVDGTLVEVDCPPRRLLPRLVEALQVLASLSVGTATLQTGEFTTVIVHGRTQRVRVYLIPTTDGPSILLRLLDQPVKAAIPADLEALAATWLNDALATGLNDSDAAEVYEQLLEDSAG